jgi:hypothetical protein
MVYNLGEMFRKRKRKNKTVHGAQPDSPPAVLAPDSSISSPITVGVYRETKTPPLLTDAFMGAIEKAADRARSELASQGKIKPTAFFVYTDGTMKVVSLSFKDELQKDGLIRRIREKALAENASDVLVLTEAEHERHVMTVLSGATPGMSASARVDYSFDKETKTVTSWKMSWLDKPVQNVFLDGIFGK